MGSLVSAFVVQTALVYLDDTASTFETLSEDAVVGRRLWHEYNCQSCHQIHGFGGFLGPDLTNAAARLTDERLTQVLTEGVAQMPAFHFDEDQRFYIATFLDELSYMGQGVPRRDKPLDVFAVRSAIETRLKDADVSESITRGADAFMQNCNVCHVPLQATPLGLHTAPDLTTVLTRIDAKAVRTTIVEGRADRGMQAWGQLPAETIDDLCAFLAWLNEDRATLAEMVGGVGVEQPIPWWEYK